MKKTITIFTIFLFFACLQTQRSNLDSAKSPGVGAGFFFLFSVFSSKSNSEAADTTPPNNIDTMVPAVADTDKATLTFTVPTDNVGVDSFDVRYSQTAVTAASCESLSNTVNITNTAASGTSVTITVTGLLSYKDFYFCAKAKDKALNKSAVWAVTTSSVKTYPRYLAVGQACSTWISGDGIVWDGSQTRVTGCNSGLSVSLNSAAFGNGTWVIVGSTSAVNTGCGIWTSSDAINWTQRVCGTDPNASPSHTTTLTTVTYGEDSTGKKEFFAGSRGNPSRKNYQSSSASPYSTWTWISNTDANSVENVYSILYSKSAGKFYMNSDTATIYSRDIGNAAVNGSTQTLTSYLGGPVRFAAGPTVGANNRIITFGYFNATLDTNYSDNNGSTWTVSSNPATAFWTQADIGILYNENDSKLVVAGKNCMSAYSSNFSTGSPSFTNGSVSGCSSPSTFRSIAYAAADKRYVIAGDLNSVSPAIAYSSDGVSWTSVTGLTPAKTIAAVAVRP